MKGAYLKSEQLAYFNRDHAWFVSYAPAQNPRIALAILVEHGGHGGEAAAPLAKKVIEKYMELQTQPLGNDRYGSKEKLVQIDRRLAAHFDWTLLLLALAVVSVGIVTIYSANYNIAEAHAGACRRGKCSGWVSAS